MLEKFVRPGIRAGSEEGRVPQVRQPEDDAEHARNRGPAIRRGLKVVVWNLEWISSLFDREARGAPRLLPDRSPLAAPQSITGRRLTAGDVLTFLTEAITDLDPDLVLMMEGPKSVAALQTMFDRIADGDWTFHLQCTRGSSLAWQKLPQGGRCVSLAVRLDRKRFSGAALAAFDTTDPAESGGFYRAANALHIITRESTIRVRYSILSNGMPTAITVPRTVPASASQNQIPSETSVQRSPSRK